jgi:hypothetical protein
MLSNLTAYLLQVKLGRFGFVDEIWIENVEFIALNRLWWWIIVVVMRLIVLVPVVPSLYKGRIILR